MFDPVHTDLEFNRFRRRSGQFAVATTVVITAIGVIVVLTLVVVLLKAHVMRIEMLQRLALSWSPTTFYLWALWSVRGMFKALAHDGFSFQPVVADTLTRVGWALGLGSVLAITEQPLVIILTRPRPVVGFATFNVPALTLGVIGLALIAVARMLRRGARWEAETVSLKAVLEDFI